MSDKYENNTFSSSKNEWITQLENELPENFYELRKEGENENYICKLIRNDSIDEFVQYVNKNNYSLLSTIKPSNYETNSVLLRLQNISQSSYSLTPIKYAAFFGSIQIFKYLQINNVELKPQLWFFAIHGKNDEIINILEENKIESDKYPYEQYFMESIKCHHNDIANYILENYLNNETSINNFIQFIRYYNFSFIKCESINQKTFPFICQYHYCSLTNILLKDENIDVNFLGNGKKTALFLAIEKNNIETIKLLISNNRIDINILNIMIIYFFKIQNHEFKYNLKIIYFNEIQNIL